MNERIRQLAEQAKLQLDQDIKDGKKDWKNTPQSYDEMVQEKLAELIVQECIDIIAPYTVRMSRPGEEYLHPIQEIKEHFGVES